MDFPNQKKTFLEKLDQSRKGAVDPLVLPLVSLLNQSPDYYTTSSCSGRIVLWTGSGKKNETEWLKVSHSPIDETFFQDLASSQLVWLRLEPFIMHIACRDLSSAGFLLDQAKPFFKKSSLLSIRNKIIVEIKGSEFIELPLKKDDQFLFKEEHLLSLADLLSQRLRQIHRKIEQFSKKIIATLK